MKRVADSVTPPLLVASALAGLFAALLVAGLSSPMTFVVDSLSFSLVAAFLAVCLRLGLSSSSSLSFGKELEGKQRLGIDEYNSLFDQSKSSAEQRKDMYEAVVNAYYDLSTTFYEYGWGQSFHFAQKSPTESFEASLARHEHLLASKLNVRPGERCLDVGCGIGGPAREISRFTGANITGLNNNAFQVQRAQQITSSQGLSGQCEFIKGDFMSIPCEDSTYDACYAIEATCHAPDRVGVFSEMLRVIKPGGRFVVYEWCLTDRYDPNNAEHREIKHLIEIGNGLPDLASTRDVEQAIKDAGFDIVEAVDIAPVNDAFPEPWYGGLQAKWSLRNLRMTALGRQITTVLVSVLETLRVAPQGALKTQKMLIKAADGVVAGGESGIFTPMFLCVAQKPID